MIKLGRTLEITCWIHICNPTMFYGLHDRDGPVNFRDDFFRYTVPLSALRRHLSLNHQTKYIRIESNVFLNPIVVTTAVTGLVKAIFSITTISWRRVMTATTSQTRNSGSFLGTWTGHFPQTFRPTSKDVRYHNHNDDTIAASYRASMFDMLAVRFKFIYRLLIRTIECHIGVSLRGAD